MGTYPGSLGGLATAFELSRHVAPEDILIVERGLDSRQGGGLNARPGTIEWARTWGIDLESVAVRTDKLIVVREGVPSNEAQLYPAEPPPGARLPLVWSYAPGDQIRHATTWSLADPAVAAANPGIEVRRARLLSIGQNYRDQPTAVLTDGSFIAAATIVGVDGASSTVRQKFAPNNDPARLGYVAFRGIVGRSTVSEPSGDLAFVDPSGRSGVFTSFQGHYSRFIVFPVPTGRMAADGTPDVELNWNLYLMLPNARLRELFDNDSGISFPGSMSEEVRLSMVHAATQLLPPMFAQMVADTLLPYARDVRYGRSTKLMFEDRGFVFLGGDAAQMVPPHTGQGWNNGVVGAKRFGEIVGPVLGAQNVDRKELRERGHRWEVEHLERSSALLQAILALPFMRPTQDDLPGARDPIGVKNLTDKPPFTPFEPSPEALDALDAVLEPVRVALPQSGRVVEVDLSIGECLEMIQLAQMQRSSVHRTLFWGQNIHVPVGSSASEFIQALSAAVGEVVRTTRDTFYKTLRAKVDSGEELQGPSAWYFEKLDGFFVYERNRDGASDSDLEAVLTVYRFLAAETLQTAEAEVVKDSAERALTIGRRVEL